MIVPFRKGRAKPPAEPRLFYSGFKFQVSGFRSVSLAVVLALAAAAPAAADTWTNVAGHSLEATPVALDGNRVILRLSSGDELRLPLQSFLPDEQRRLKEFLGVLVVPPPLRSVFHLTESQLQTARALYEDGQIDGKDYNARRKDVIDSFNRKCTELSYAEDSDEIRQLVARLMAR